VAIDDGPRLDRSVTVHFQGDPGQANMHRICGWLAQELGYRTGPHTRTAIWNGHGGTDNLRAVGRGEVDVAVFTPAPAAKMAMRGLGPHVGEPLPGLRALGVVAHRDAVLLAIRADLGIRTIDDLKARRPALRLATGPADGVNHTGLAASELLAAEGISLDDWGGSVWEDERLVPALARVRAGESDAILQEAIMTPPWQEAAQAMPLAFVPFSDAALADVESRLEWPRLVIPAGYLPGLDEPVQTLDFSDFLLVTREDLADDLAYLLAWCLVQRREVLERMYHHWPQERSPVGWPLDPRAMTRTPIPLHDGAARCYEELLER
jgi:TRAP transporter TAXI family solute receptor